MGTGLRRGGRVSWKSALKKSTYGVFQPHGPRGEEIAGADSRGLVGKELPPRGTAPARERDAGGGRSWGWPW